VGTASSTELTQKQQDLLLLSNSNGAVMQAGAWQKLFVILVIPMPTAMPIVKSSTGHKSKRLSVGAIIGITIGCVAFTAIGFAVLKGLYFGDRTRVSKYAIYSEDVNDIVDGNIPRNDWKRKANDVELAPLARTDNSVVKSTRFFNQELTFAESNPIYTKTDVVRAKAGESKV